MLTQIKIMLGLCDDAEQNAEHKNNYDSFVDDVKSSDNKVGPNMDDHNLLSKLAQKLRTGYDNSRRLEEPHSEGFLEKIRRVLGRHE
jgi:hypothetical protein